METREKEYTYHEATIAICSQCLKRIPGKIIFKNNQVFLQKTCPTHGMDEILFEEDIDYYLNKRNFDQPGTKSALQTTVRKGCPFDCGLCPEHDQHSCIGLIEITDNCDLECPVCYAGSKRDAAAHLPLDVITRMVDLFIDSENGHGEILQLSGGEPTTHPQIIDIIKMIKTKNIGYLMLNTNGLRIAEDEAFVQELSRYRDKFEIYLQFDGVSAQTYRQFRGRDLLSLKLRAIENLRKYKLPITLVTTVTPTCNLHEIGEIISLGLTKSGIRGVNFQPLAYFGRLPKKQQSERRITLSGIIKELEQQLPQLFQPGDIIPLPCNVERVAVSYLIKRNNQSFTPITRLVDIKSNLHLIDNTFAFNADSLLKNNEVLFPGSCCHCLDKIKNFKDIFPLNFMFKPMAEKLDYIDRKTFRLSITSFLDYDNFDLKSMQKECVHVITPDLRKIPFSAYNMFHRK